jgi:hypothetical protein
MSAFFEHHQNNIKFRYRINLPINPEKALGSGSVQERLNAAIQKKAVEAVARIRRCSRGTVAMIEPPRRSSSN